MDHLEKVKKQFGLILGILGVIDLVLLAYLLWPGTSPTAKQAREAALPEEHRMRVADHGCDRDALRQCTLRHVGAEVRAGWPHLR